ncbi:MAG TPA: styrene monooxygenase/indole monooxygenase family protein [Herpetosiphonaceae bacterium]
MKQIGIVGAGIAGLHLGLLLQQQRVRVTLYAERTPEQHLAGWLSSVVTRFGPTRERERALGVNHWDLPDFGVFCFYVNIVGEQPLTFCGHLSQPAAVVDMRIYHATLLQDFVGRGGQVEYGTLEPADLERLSEEHDLVVVATGRGSLTDLFPRIEEYSPFSAPQRHLFGGLFRGVSYPDPLGVTYAIVPGQGEISAIPFYSFEGRQSALFCEAIPGGAFDVLTQMSYADDPQHFEATLLDLIRVHAPPIYERINPAEFGLTRPLDLIQGAITPVVRRGYAQLPNGKWVVALGDAHALNDPCIAQGANAASHAAWMLGDAILQRASYDEAFCREVEQRVWEYLGAATAWTNETLAPTFAHVGELFAAAGQSQTIANAVVDNFADPQGGWAITCDAEAMAAFLQQRGWSMSSDSLTVG